MYPLHPTQVEKKNQRKFNAVYCQVVNQNTLCYFLGQKNPKKCKRATTQMLGLSLKLKLWAQCSMWAQNCKKKKKRLHC